MPRFRCIEPTCNRVRPRATPPVDCATRDRCEFRELSEAGEPEPPRSAPCEEIKEISLPPTRVQTPLEPSAHASLPIPMLILIAGKSFQITDKTLLGRKGTIAIELFNEDPKYRAVSREHCLVKPTASGWELTAVSASSPTTLDGHIVPPAHSVLLSEGRHSLLLGEILPLELHLPAAPPATPNTSSAVEDGFMGELQKYLATEA